MSWKEDHEKLYGKLGEQKFLPAPRVVRLKGSVRVSSEIHTIIQDHEAAVMKLHVAEGREEIDNAYGALCQRRRELYEYVEGLEAALGIPQTILKRF